MASTVTVTNQWLTKYEAAERLNLSDRRVLVLAKAGRLDKKSERDASGQMAVMINAGSVERYLYELEHPELQGASGETGVSAARPAQPALLGASGATGAPPTHLARLTRPWMTVDEAAEDQGLPANFLLKLIESGKLRALDVGVRPGGRYRVCRKDLEELRGELIVL